MRDRNGQDQERTEMENKEKDIFIEEAIKLARDLALEKFQECTG